ncbi:MAG: hypothetical protein Q9171_007337 [Xanthocarpia ochracea]
MSRNKSEANLHKYRQIEDFTKKQVAVFYPAGRGIGTSDYGRRGLRLAWHPSFYLGQPFQYLWRESAASEHQWYAPMLRALGLYLRYGGKDVIVALCGLFSYDEVLNHAIEFADSEATLKIVAVDNRFAIANMTTEWRALTGLFPIDETQRRWLRYKATEAAMCIESLGSTS